MPFNIDIACQTIAKVRHQCSRPDLRVMVGGQAMAIVPDIWRAIAADGYAPDARAGVQLAAKWWEEICKPRQ